MDDLIKLSSSTMLDMIDGSLENLRSAMASCGQCMVEETISVYKKRKDRCHDKISLVYLYLDIQESIAFAS
jgi:hypothetical protein